MAWLERIFPTRIGQNIAARHAHPRLVRAVVFGVEKLNRVRRHQRRVRLRRQLRCEQRLCLRLRRVQTLHFEVKAVVECGAPLLQGALRLCGFVLEQQLTDFAIVRARQRDQAVIGLVQQPFGVNLRVIALIVHHIGARDQIAQAVVALRVLDQQQQAKRRAFVVRIDDVHVRAEDGLDALIARLFIKLNQPERIHQIGHRQRRLIIRARFAHRVAHANDAVGDGKFAVHA